MTSARIKRKSHQVSLQALKIAELAQLSVHGPEQELAKLRGPLAKLKPQFFTLEYGFRR
jgi:hypothetical protein